MNTYSIISKFNQAFNQHDVDGMMALFTGECIFENTYPAPDGARYQGQSAVRAFWEEFFHQSPRANIEIEEIFTCGSRAYQCWRYQWGTGYVRGVDLFRLEGDRISEKLSYVKG